MTKPFWKTRKGCALMHAFWMYLLAVIVLNLGYQFDFYSLSIYSFLSGIAGLVLIGWLGHAVSPGSFPEKPETKSLDVSEDSD